MSTAPVTTSDSSTTATDRRALTATGHDARLEAIAEKVEAGDFVAGVVGQNIVLEGMAFTVFEMMEAGNRELNPKFAHTLRGTIADERRHVGFGENRIGSLIQQHPERKADIERQAGDFTRGLQRELG